MDPRYHDPLLGVVFDLDGTLVLSEHAFERMRHEVIRIAEEHGVPAGALSPTETIPRILERALGEIERAGRSRGDRYRFEAAAHRRIDEIELEALPRTTVRPGAEELLRGLAGRGYRLGILTRSSEPFATAALQRVGLRGLVPFLRTRTDSGPAKPDPEALLRLLTAMSVPPARAVYVGDHILDAECAVRAQVKFYAVLPVETGSLGTDADRFRAAGASAVARDLGELARQLDVLPPPSGDAG